MRAIYAHLTAVYVDHNLQQQYLASLACDPTNSLHEMI